MASMYKRKDKAKSAFVVRYKDPLSLKWKSEAYSSKVKAQEAEQKWSLIETYRKNGNPAWQDMYYQQDQVVTIQDVFTAYENNVLANKTNELTVKKYKAVMNSALDVFPSDTPVESIRGLTREMGVGRKQGWEIYKAHRDYTCSRHGINSYLRDLRNIFMWALANGGPQGRGMVNFEVITKKDKYGEADLEDLEIKIWQDDEILHLFTHPDLSEFHKDLMAVYFYTGARAVELLGYNYRNRKKELKWHHIDFAERTITLLPKRKKTRQLAKQHPIVMTILKKWQEQGNEMPLPFGYKKLRQIIAEINEITGISFTCHDLRRMKSQIGEEEFGDLRLAGYAIGDTTTAVVKKHYAPVSLSTMDRINNGIHNRLQKKMGGKH